MRVVGDKELREWLLHDRVEARRRTGHLTDRAGCDHAGAQGARLGIGPADHDGHGVSQAESPNQGRSQLADHLVGTPNRRHRLRVDLQGGKHLGVPAACPQVV